MVQVSGFVFEMGSVSKTISWVCSKIACEKKEKGWLGYFWHMMYVSLQPSASTSLKAEDFVLNHEVCRSCYIF